MKRGTLCTKLDAFPLAGLDRSSNLVLSVVSIESRHFSVRFLVWRKIMSQKESGIFASQNTPTKNKTETSEDSAIPEAQKAHTVYSGCFLK